MSRVSASPSRFLRRRLEAILVATALVVLVCAPGDAEAQRLELSVTPSSFTFPSADPDIAPTVAAPTLTLRYRVQQNLGAQWRITLLSSGDLISGGASIPISNVTWTASPSPPFQDGRMSASAEQLVASGYGNDIPATNGWVTFQLVNSWSYAAGIYTQSFVFTISAP